jgi:hypothetical protein
MSFIIIEMPSLKNNMTPTAPIRLAKIRLLEKSKFNKDVTKKDASHFSPWDFSPGRHVACNMEELGRHFFSCKISTLLIEKMHKTFFCVCAQNMMLEDIKEFASTFKNTSIKGRNLCLFSRQWVLKKEQDLCVRPSISNYSDVSCL